MSMLIIFAATFFVFLLVIVGMAVGVMLGRREISGSCGGLANQPGEDGNSACSLCSRPSSDCKELKAQVNSNATQRVSPTETSHSSHFDDCEKDCVQEGCTAEEISACKEG